MRRPRAAVPPLRLARVALVTCVAFASLVAAAGGASAEEAERIAVRYEAHPLCPDESAFVAEVSARTSRFRRVPREEAARGFRVTLSEEPGQSLTRGELVLTEGDAESTRVVHDENCAVVVSGLALIAALAVDPEAETGPVDPLAAPASRPPPPPPPARSPPSLDAPSTRPSTRPTGTEPLRPARRIRLGAAAGIATRAGLVPLTAAVAIAGLVAVDGASGIHPQARLELSAGAPRVESAGGPAARLSWFGGHVEGCGLVGRGVMRLGPCGLAELGAVRATGIAVSDARSTTRIGSSLGAGVRGALTTGRLYADLGAFVLVPFRRDRFYVDAPAGQSITVFQTATLGAQVGADVGVLF